jgi:hypothetical protein
MAEGPRVAARNAVPGALRVRAHVRPVVPARRAGPEVGGPRVTEVEEVRGPGPEKQALYARLAENVRQRDAAREGHRPDRERAADKRIEELLDRLLEVRG